MSQLQAQQNALLDALFAWPPQNAMKIVAAHAMDTGARGLKAYQSNGHALAERALAVAYPVLAQLLGTESFADLARALWHAHPPVSGDAGLWGAALSEFVQGNAQLQDEPYLADVAAAEWGLHQCSTALDVAPDPASLALLTEHDPERLFLTLAPGCLALRSAWPVASILGAHRENSPTLAQAGQDVQNVVAQELVVWREGFKPRTRQALAGEVDLLVALLGGQTLGEALDVATALDFGVWFPVALQTGLVLGAFMKPESEPPGSSSITKNFP